MSELLIQFWEESEGARIIIDEKFFVLAANTAARNLLRDEDALKLNAGRLGFMSKAAQDEATVFFTRRFRRRTAFVAPSTHHDHPPIIISAQTISPRGLPLRHALELKRAERPSVVRLIHVARRMRLTPTEMQVVEKVARGIDVEAAADEMGIQIETVRTHLKRIYTKLGISSRGELFALIMRHI